NQLRVLHKEEPGGGDDQGQGGDGHSGQAQVGAGDGRKIIIICLLDDVKHRGGQNHGGGGIVNQDNDISLQNGGRRRVRPLGELELGEGIVPFVGKYALRQTLLVHGQGVHDQAADPVPDGVKERPIHPVLHIAEGNVRVGALPGA